MKRLAFLPLFFTLLAFAFGAAVWVRLGDYESADAQSTPQQTAELRGEQANRTQSLSDETTPIGSEGSIEEFPNADGTRPRGQGMSARERRYNELLRAAPPAPPLPAKEASLLDRMVAPIASALGMKPKAAPQAPPQRPPQTARDQQKEQPQQKEPSQDTTTRDPQEEQDADTDVTPPTLVSAEFIPSQVHDGEETTLSVHVTDNLSGVRGVSGVIAGPGTGMQGFACHREGDGARFMAKITVPKNAAEGVWSVRYLTLSDNASNSVNLNAAQGALPPTASFRVTSSTSDAAGPTLASVKIERPAMRAGERNTVFVQADDDKAGVSLVSGVFISPAKHARLGFGCRLTGSGLWECPLTPPNCLDCGLWQLEQIQLQDKANNMATFRADNPAVAGVNVEIQGDRCDSEPPVIQSLSVNPPVISNLEGGTVRIEAIVTDQVCGVASLSGQAIPPGGVGGQRAYFSFDPSQDGRVFVGRIPVAKHSAKGVWTIAWIQALDKGHNLQPYSTGHPVIARTTFRVE